MQITDEMVERGARAVWAHRQQELVKCGIPPSRPWKRLLEDTRQRMRDEVRAALEAAFDSGQEEALP